MAGWPSVYWGRAKSRQQGLSENLDIDLELILWLGTYAMPCGRLLSSVFTDDLADSQGFVGAGTTMCRVIARWASMKDGRLFLNVFGKAFDFAPPLEDGYDTVSAIQAMLDSPDKVFFAMGGNFATATPDTPLTHRALQNALTVHVTTKLNRSQLVCGHEALILPCLGRTEIDIQASRRNGDGGRFDEHGAFVVWHQPTGIARFII